MLKNGLCIMSIGFLAFIYSCNPVQGTYNWINLITATFIIIVGFVVYRKGKKRATTKKE